MPLESSLFEIDNAHVHTTAVKRADDNNGIIIRYYNPMETEQKVTIKTNGNIYLCKMDESVVEKIDNTYTASAKKIVTVRIVK